MIEYTVKDRIAIITLNRPEKRNALNNQLVNELKRAFDRAEQDTSCKVIILKARGETFCAGADLAYLQQLQKFSFKENLEDSTDLKELFLKIYKHPKVVIAQVQGAALAGGCGLATVCDFSFAAVEAKFGYTEVMIGFIPAIVMVFLIRKIGEAKARELLLSGNIIIAEEALRMGLINNVFLQDALESETLRFAQRLVSANSGESMKLTKQMIADVQHMKIEDALSFAADLNAKARGSEDCKRGIAAFLNKEKIIW